MNDGVQTRKISITPGSLATTLHASRISDNEASENDNCDVSSGVWKAGYRYRQWQPAPAVGTAQGCIYGFWNGTEEVWAFSAGNTYKHNGATIHTADGAVSGWSSDLDSTVSGSAEWVMWQAGKYLFAANETHGIRWKQIGSTFVDGGVTAVPEIKGGTPDRFPGLSVGNYVHQPMDVLSLSITCTENDPGWEPVELNKDRALFDPTNASTELDVVGYITIDFEGSTPAVDFGEMLRRYVYCVLKAQGQSAIWHYTGGDSSPVKVVVKEASPGTGEYVVPIAAEFVGELGAGDGSSDSGGNALAIRMDMKDCPYWPAFPDGTSTIGSIEIHFTITADPSDAIELYGLWLTGHDVKSLRGSTYSSVGVSACYVDADGANGGKAYGPLCPEMTLPARDVDGYNPYNWFSIEHQTVPQIMKISPAFPKGGIIPRLTIFGAGSPPSPLTSSDSIAVFLRIGSTQHLVDEYIISDYTVNDDVIIDTMADREIVFKKSEALIRDGGDLAVIFPAGAHSLRNFGANATCGCVWGNSNAIAKSDGYIYFSRVNHPFDFIWSAAQVPDEVDANDYGMPQIVQVGTGNNSVYAMVPVGPVLFIFTSRGVYYMEGQYPAKAGTPKALNGTYGILGKRAACQAPGGALYGSASGLCFVRADGGHEEVTKAVSPTWEWLVGGETDGVCLAYRADEIFAFCKNRMMVRDKFGNWWTDTLLKDVECVTSDAIRGVILQFTDGTMGVIGEYSTYGGTNTAGSNGTAGGWSYTSKKFTGSLQIHKILATFTNAASSNLVFTVKSENNPTGANASVTYTSTTPPFQNIGKYGKPYGSWVQFVVSGNYGDELHTMLLEISGHHEGTP